MEEPLVWAFLRKVQVHDLPCPEVLLQDDEDLCFEWVGGAARVISVVLSPSGRTSWAALVGDYQAAGKFQWPDWSSDLDQAFVRFNG